MDGQEGCYGLGPRGSESQPQMAEAWAFIRSEGIGRQMDRWVDGQGGSWCGPGQVVGIPLAEALGTAGSPLTAGSLSHASLSDGMPVRPSPPRVSVLCTGFRKGVTRSVGLVYLIKKPFSTSILCVSFCACVLVHVCPGMHVCGGRRTACRNSFSLPLCGVQGLNLGPQVGQQTPLPSERPGRLCLCILDRVLIHLRAHMLRVYFSKFSGYTLYFCEYGVYWFTYHGWSWAGGDTYVHKQHVISPK